MERMNSWNLIGSEVPEIIAQAGITHPDLVLSKLEQMCNDKDKEIQEKAVRVLEHLGESHPQFTLPILLKLLSNSDDYNRAIYALRGVGKANPGQVIPLLIKCFNVRKNWSSAVDALEEIIPVDPKIMPVNPSFAWPLLLKILNNDSCRHVAAKILQNCDLSLIFYFVNPEGPWLTGSSLKSLVESSLDLRSHAIQAILLKCIEGNLAIFMENQAICFYEKGEKHQIFMNQMTLENFSQEMFHTWTQAQIKK